MPLDEGRGGRTAVVSVCIRRRWAGVIACGGDDLVLEEDLYFVLITGRGVSGGRPGEIGGSSSI